VAAIAEVEAYVLRFWESEFEGLRPAKSTTNQRRYTRRDVELVLRIRDLLYDDGYTIEGARKRLRRGVKEARPEVPTRTRVVLDRVRKDVEQLLRLVEE
jgi:DNA-binding transcriptional MerR regulator